MKVLKYKNEFVNFSMFTLNREQTLNLSCFRAIFSNGKDFFLKSGSIFFQIPSYFVSLRKFDVVFDDFKWVYLEDAKVGDSVEVILLEERFHKILVYTVQSKKSVFLSYSGVVCLGDKIIDSCFEGIVRPQKVIFLRSNK